ncbi:rRNA maturation RNase YbeY [bacterium]|nr:rRNA maturation RNase YbeY [bacterium]
MIQHFISDGIKYDTKLVDTIIQKIFSDYNCDLLSLQVIQVSDNELLSINRDFLQHNYLTDIITFTLSENPIEGELYISYERVQENGKENNSSFEIYRVVFHGCLHLCGFNDSTEQEKKQIRSLEDWYLSFVPRGT